MTSTKTLSRQDIFFNLLVFIYIKKFTDQDKSYLELFLRKLLSEKERFCYYLYLIFLKAVWISQYPRNTLEDEILSNLDLNFFFGYIK